MRDPVSHALGILYQNYQIPGWMQWGATYSARGLVSAIFENSRALLASFKGACWLEFMPERGCTFLLKLSCNQIHFLSFLSIHMLLEILQELSWLTCAYTLGNQSGSLGRTFDVCCAIYHALCWSNVVLHNFCSGQIYSRHGQLAGVINQVSPPQRWGCSWDCRLRAIVNNHLCTSDCTILWDCGNLIMGGKSHYICTFFIYVISIWISLHNISQFIKHCFQPGFLQLGA